MIKAVMSLTIRTSLLGLLRAAASMFLRNPMGPRVQSWNLKMIKITIKYYMSIDIKNYFKMIKYFL